MDTIAGILQVLLAAVFAFAGGSKVAGIRMQVDNFNRYGYPQWFRVFTGLVELVAAAGMVVGLFVGEVAITAGIVLGASWWALRTPTFESRRRSWSLRRSCCSP